MPARYTPLWSFFNEKVNFIHGQFPLVGTVSSIITTPS